MVATKNLEKFYLNRPVADLTSLKTDVDVAGMVDGAMVEVVSMGTFAYYSSSTETADDINIVEPALGIGRFKRLDMLNFKVTPSGDKISADILEIQGPFVFKGIINVAADFPTLAAVQPGWTYVAGANVTDNDPTKTNTGQSFTTGDRFSWIDDPTGAWVITSEAQIWIDDGSVVKTVNPDRDIDLQLGNLRDDTSTAVDGIPLTDADETEFDPNFNNVSIIGVINENKGTIKLTNLGTGFPRQDDSKITFVDLSRTFTIEPTSGSFNYYINGQRFTKTAADSIVISNIDGLHFIYYDGDTLTETTTPDLEIIYSQGFISYVYWDLANQKQIIFANERHHFMDVESHVYLHQVLGAQLISLNDFGLNTIDADASGNLNTSAQFGVGAGTLRDEDLETSSDAIASLTGIPVYYRTGPTLWNIKEADGYAIIYSGDASGYVGPNGRAAYNPETAGVYSLEEVPNNDFFGIIVYATNAVDVNRKVIAILGQDSYPTLLQARDGILTLAGDLNRDNLPFQEFKAVAAVLFQTSSAYGNIPSARIRSVIDPVTGNNVDYLDLRAGVGGISGGGSGGASHLSLSDLTSATVPDVGHSQFALLQGRAGGQELTGGTAAFENLDFKTTSNATKGKYRFLELTTNGVVQTTGGNGSLFVDQKLANGTTATTQAPTDDSDKVATTAFVNEFIVAPVIDALTISSPGQTAFTLSETPNTSALGFLTLNGQVKTDGTDYTVLGTDLTWNDPGGLTLKTSDELIYRYNYNPISFPTVVTSFNSRTGAVVPDDGDYSTSQITNDTVIPGTYAKDAIDSIYNKVIAPKTIFIEITASDAVRGYANKPIPSSGSGSFTFAIPDDFDSLISIDLLGFPRSGAPGTGRDIDLLADYCSVGEPYNQHSQTNITSTYTVGALNYLWALDISSVFSSLSAGDVCGLQVTHNSIGGEILYLQIKLTYNRIW